MKNKQINKVLLMFFLSFTLFFSVSNAFTLEANVDYTNGSPSKSTITSFVGYSSSNINTICMNYYNDSSNEEYITAFNDMIFAFSAEGYDKYFIQSYKATAGIDDIYAYFFPSSVDVCTNSANSSIYFCFDNTETLIEWKGTVSKLYKNTVTVPTIFGVGSYFSNPFYTNVNVKQTTPSTQSYYFYWDGETYFYKAESEPDIPTMSDSKFSAMLEEITTSELFYQHIPSDYRSNFYVQYDVNSDNYLFYFYPSNYQVYGLLRNENDYNVICDKDFSWWDNVVDFISKIFVRETENLDYKMIYVSVLDDGTYSCWYRSKLMNSVDETLFNLELNPIVYSSVQIPFYGKHGGGGINIDTGDKTLASSPEHVINDSVYGESNIVYNPNHIETVPNEQSFWDKVVNRLSSIVSFIKDIPSELIEKYQSKIGAPTVIKLALPLITGILTIVNVLISSIALISRAVTFVYTLPTIEASSALFSVDVAETTTGLSFVGHNWGAKFLEGLDMLKGFSWNGLNLWNLFSAFIAAVFAIQVIKYVRKHYHY